MCQNQPDKALKMIHWQACGAEHLGDRCQAGCAHLCSCVDRVFVRGEERDDDDDQNDDGDDDMRICVPCARSIFEPARLIKTQPGPSSSDPHLHHFDILTAGRKIIVVFVVVDGYHDNHGD